MAPPRRRVRLPPGSVCSHPVRRRTAQSDLTTRKTFALGPSLGAQHARTAQNKDHGLFLKPDSLHRFISNSHGIRNLILSSVANQPQIPISPRAFPIENFASLDDPVGKYPMPPSNLIC
jgi:hypothetical protein